VRGTAQQGVEAQVLPPVEEGVLGPVQDADDERAVRDVDPARAEPEERALVERRCGSGAGPWLEVVDGVSRLSACWSRVALSIPYGARRRPA
jgi:hypothetical protein